MWVCIPGAEAFTIKPDPFAFPDENPAVSAYSLGPFLRLNSGHSHELAFRPLFYFKKDISAGAVSMDLLYPFFHYSQDSEGYKAGFLFNLISFSKSSFLASGEPETDFRFYPFIFYRPSPDPDKRIFSVAPFYGNFANKVKFVLFPLYLRINSRSGAVSHNVLWPLFAFYSGERKGFRFWPLFGQYREKGASAKFAMWPFYFEKEKGAGRLRRYHKALAPFYYRFDYGSESHRIYLWPLFQKSTDPVRNLKSFHMPWPIINYKTSDDSYRTRFFPFFEKSEEADLKKTRFLLWPLYTSSEIFYETHKQKKDSFLIVLKIKRETPLRKNASPSLRVDLWPVFSYKRDRRQNSHFHLISPFEPFIGSSEKLYRNYSFIWRVLEVRREKGKGTSVSFLFNMLNFRKSCERSHFSIAGKAFGYFSDRSGRRIRFLFIPVKIGKAPKNAEMCG